MCRLLYVDDQTHFSQILRQFLKRYKVTFQSCLGAVAAIELAQKFDPDLVLASLHQHGVNCTSFVESIYEQTTYKLPIVFMTTDPYHEALEHLKAKSLPYIVAAPFDKNIFIQTLQQACHQDTLDHILKL